VPAWRPCALCATPGLYQARAEDKSRDFAASEHKRRQIKVAAEGVADAGLAFNGHAGELEVAHVAIDGAGRDLQLDGELLRGDEPAGAEKLDDAKETISTAHAPW
jgi:hypothetical protein